MSGQPLHPVTAQTSPMTSVLGRYPVNSLLGLSNTNCEQPQARGYFLLVVILCTALAGKEEHLQRGVEERMRDQREQE